MTVFSLVLTSIFVFFSGQLQAGGTTTAEKHYAVVVIGGGLMGSAAAWQLARDGKEVILLEKQDREYSQGSSKGLTRIARSNNLGSDLWSYLHNRSVQETATLVNYLGNQGDDISMSAVYQTTPVNYMRPLKAADAIIASSERQKVDYKLALTPEEGMEMFGVQLPEEVFLHREFNEHSGTLNPEALISLLHRAIKLKGGTIVYNASVSDIQRQGNYYLVATKDSQGSERKLTASQIVSAAGPYTGPLLTKLAPYMDKLITPKRVFLAFLQISPAKYHQLDDHARSQLRRAYPVINSSAGTREGSFYSMFESSDADGNPVIKIGGHFQRSDINKLDDVWHQALSEEEIRWSIENTGRYLRMHGVPVNDEDLQLVDEVSCVYSLTSTEVPIVSQLVAPSGDMDSNFVVMAGMSGVGAKGAMTYGRIAANLLQGKSESDPGYLEAVKAVGFTRLKEDVDQLLVSPEK
ncbi:FAD-dependent oxidoreductase [Thalassotalea sp. G20_0]|uniref:NAD(P)/FAD-dependent oxidoreductase n=1 Tax=Thalassotalea sp. G20_0 TaxID=2821093 RepID=UPI001ADCC8EC|nr:FAD-dependent oxidoreductase [Thalassotalea sp. G20_0]MBO9495462.1 FAD-dependent oxidoreductase [Thalassotalea sp. G20_0]